MNLRNLAVISLLFLYILPTLSLAQTEPPVLLNVSCQDASLRDVLRAIAVQHGVSLAGLGAVSGTVTIHLDNAPLDDGLSALLEPMGFTYEKRNKIYFIRRAVPQIERILLTVTDDRLTLSANRADVNRVIQMLNTEAGISIVAANNLVGTVTAHLKDVPVNDAIPALFAGDQFLLNENNGVYRVATRQAGKATGLAIFVNDGLISIFAYNVSLTQALSELADQAKINLATVGNAEAKVTFRLQNQPLPDILHNIAQITGNTYRQVGDIHFFGKGDIKPGEDNPLLERKIVWLKHIDAQEVLSLLPGDIPTQHFAVSLDHNALILVGPPHVIEKTEALIVELDIDNADIRSRQAWAISIELDSEMQRLTVDVKNAPIEMVVRELSVQTGIDLLFLGDAEIQPTRQQPRITPVRRVPTRTPVQQVQPPAQTQTSQPASRRRLTALNNERSTVTLRLAHATLEEVLTALFKGTSYTYKLEQHGDTELYIVGTGELIEGNQNPLVVSKQIRLNYLDVTKVLDLLPPTVPDTHVTVIADQNALMVMGVPQMVDEIEAYIAEIDLPTPQVMIQVYLLELTHGSRAELGLTLDGEKERTLISLAPGFALSFDSLERVPEAFAATLTALVTENRGEVLANPLVSVVSGEKATVDVGVTTFFETTTEIYRGADVPVGGYTRRGFNTIEAGIKLDITPWIGAAENITMSIRPEVTIPTLISREQSIISERLFDTVIRVKNEGMIVMGGLLQEQESVRENKVPILGSIPLLGGLFTSRDTNSEQTELIVIIQPKILR
jgi:type II secretory pathway component GspD/PulD (secretin)